MSSPAEYASVQKERHGYRIMDALETAMSGLLSILVTIILAGLIFYLLFYLLGVIGLPEPFSKVATVLLALVAVIFLIGLLTGSVPMVKLG